MVKFPKKIGISNCMVYFLHFCYAAMSKQSKAGSRTCFRLIETNFKIKKKQNLYGYAHKIT